MYILDEVKGQRVKITLDRDDLLKAIKFYLYEKKGLTWVNGTTAHLNVGSRNDASDLTIVVEVENNEALLKKVNKELAEATAVRDDLNASNNPKG